MRNVVLTLGLLALALPVFGKTASFADFDARAAAQADLDALAAAWRRAWGNAALPFRRLGKDDLNEGRMK